MDIPKELFEKLDRSKELTVDEAIKLLQEYKKKYGGDHKLEIQAYWGGGSISGITVYDIDNENGPWCTIYAEDNYRLYGPLFRDIHNGGPLENFINEKDK